MSEGEAGEGLQAALMIEFTDAELLARLRNTEDNFVERKSKGDRKDWLPAVVAFANSVPIDYPAILFIGVRDTGELEGGACNFESLQKTFSQELAKAYPPIYYCPRALREGDAECLAVIIPGSKQRPHFAGRSYVRVGPETREASEEQFAALIADRNAKVYEIRRSLGKTTHVALRRRSGETIQIIRSWGIVIEANQFYVSFRSFSQNAENARRLNRLAEVRGEGQMHSAPLSRVELSYDHEHEMLRLEIREEP